MPRDDDTRIESSDERDATSESVRDGGSQENERMANADSSAKPSDTDSEAEKASPAGEPAKSKEALAAAGGVEIAGTGLEAAFAKTVARNFKHATISEAMDYLSNTTGVKFQLDMKSLFNDQGVTKNMPVTLDATSMTVREFMDEVIVKRVKAVYEIRGDKVVIVSRKAAKKATAAEKS
jgi:hypothetical protein